MVKQTQKMMVIAAAALLLLLAFGLGFYTYPLIVPLDRGQASIRGDTAGLGEWGLGEASDDTVQTKPRDVAQSHHDNSTELSTSSTSQQPVTSQATTPQMQTTQMTVEELDLSGVEPEDLVVFLDAWRALDRDFFGDKPLRRQQIYGAIRGLLQSYDDPYTFFIEPETNEVEQGNLRGSFGGIGAHVQPSALGFVLDPIRDNPAQKAGIKKGDYLVRVDATAIDKDTPIDDIIALIRGPLDTDVELGLLRPIDVDNVSEASLKEAESLTITVTRAEIRTPSMDWRIITGDEIPIDNMLEALRLAGSKPEPLVPDESAANKPSSDEAKSEGTSPDDTNSGDTNSGTHETDMSEIEGEPSALPLGVTEQDIEAWKAVRIGYIQHRIYSDRSPDEMRTAMEELLAQGADRFIIDLRGNPGGPVTAVVQVTDLWTDDSLIMLEEKADGGKKRFEASSDTVVGDEPILIVVDGGSASASEIFAGALRDHKRALILGEKTFGKGSVQVIHVLPDTSSMHITNAHWFTPNGHRIDGTGLIPDIEIEPGTDPLQEAIRHILDVDIE